MTPLSPPAVEPCNVRSALLCHRFTLSQLLMTIPLVGIALAFFLQPRPAGQNPWIVSSLASSRDGKFLAIAKLDDQEVLGRRYATRTISIVEVASATTIAVVERERLRDNVGSARAYWYYDDSVIGFSSHHSALIVERCDDHGWHRYDLTKNPNRYLVADGYSKPLWNHTQVAVSRNPGTYVIWDIETGVGFRYHALVCPAEIHSSLINRSSASDRFMIADEDADAIASALACALSPVGHVVAVEHEGLLRICDFDNQETTTYPCSTARRLSFSEDGKKLAIAGKNLVRVVDVGTGEEKCSLLHEREIASVAWSGDVIAIGDFSGQLTLWSPTNNDEPITIEVAGAAYSSRKPVAITLGIWLTACFVLVVRRAWRRKLRRIDAVGPTEIGQ